MRMLVDANISFRIVKDLIGVFETVKHVDRIGLEVPAKDLEIWNWAKENDFFILTFDEDFLYFELLYGFPPKVVLLRIGNTSSKEISTLLLNLKPQIFDFLENGTEGILEIIENSTRNLNK